MFDTIAKDVAVLDDNVSLMDAYPEFDPAVCRQGDIPFRHRRLDLGRAAQRIDHAGELHQQAVAGGLDDAAPVLGDLGIDQLAAVRLEPRKRPFLVDADQPAVARDVRGENGSQPAFDAFRGQSGAPNRRGSRSQSNSKYASGQSISLR